MFELLVQPTPRRETGELAAQRGRFGALPGSTARRIGFRACHMKIPVAASIISSDAVAASTETRQRLIDPTSGPAKTTAETSAVTRSQVRYALDAPNLTTEKPSSASV